MKSIKKLASAMIILTLSATAVAFPAEAKTFSDVPQSHWAYSVIDEASDDGIMKGCRCVCAKRHTHPRRICDHAL